MEASKDTFVTFLRTVGSRRPITPTRRDRNDDTVPVVLAALRQGSKTMTDLLLLTRISPARLQETLSSMVLRRLVRVDDGQVQPHFELTTSGRAELSRFESRVAEEVSNS